MIIKAKSLVFCSGKKVRPVLLKLKLVVVKITVLPLIVTVSRIKNRPRIRNCVDQTIKRSTKTW